MSKSKWGKSPVDVLGNKPLFVDLLRINEINGRAYANSNWIAAVYAWDYQDSSLLDEMLRRHAIPFELQPVIADIVTGKRSRSGKGASKIVIPAAHRMYFAAWYLDRKRNIIDVTLSRCSARDFHKTAFDEMKEVHQKRSELLAVARKFKSEVARLAGVSIPTLENLADELQAKIKNYPNI